MSKTSDYTALGPLVGFVYQIYYFLSRLLTIQDGETVSLEKIDDVGVETGEKKTYLQLKHSINSKPCGFVSLRSKAMRRHNAYGLQIASLYSYPIKALRITGSLNWLRLIKRMIVNGMS